MTLKQTGTSVKWSIAACFLGMACSHAPSPSAQYFTTSDDLPFSEAVQVGDMLYLSGQIGVLPGTVDLVPGGMTAEARQTMDNIGDVLERRGLGFNAIVKCTIMLEDMSDWEAFNEVYVNYFPKGRLPARSAFGTSGLAFNAKLEVECWAHNPTAAATP